LTEGDVFRIVIPFSSNVLASSNEANVKLIDANHEANSDANEANSEANSRELYDRILEKAESNPHITQKELADDLGVSRSTVQRAMDDLKDQKRLERIDGTRGYWKVNRK
jgi:predicted HTH transcriptional regulator